LAAMLRSVVAGLRWCARRYLCALDVSWRWHAAVEHAKHCDLIYDPATGIFFGTRPRERGYRRGGAEA
jgi:predicted metal-dependent hydrolase